MGEFKVFWKTVDTCLPITPTKLPINIDFNFHRKQRQKKSEGKTSVTEKIIGSGEW